LSLHDIPRHRENGHPISQESELDHQDDTVVRRHVDILVIDECRLFREALQPLLDDADFSVLGEAESVEAAVSQLETGIVPRLVLVDFETAEEDLSAIRRLREYVPDVKLVILAASASDVHSLALCFEAGADAYLLKAISPDALSQSLKLVLMGEKVFPTRLAAMLVGGAAPRRPPVAGEVSQLSPREYQILHCLLTGQSNKLIARALKITEATVKVHLKGLMKKIRAANRTQAALWAINHGLHTGDDPFAIPPPIALPSHQHTGR
jgi:two-component system, NarL family, nitrate/nitrite response regulator NarL